MVFLRKLLATSAKVTFSHAVYGYIDRTKPHVNVEQLPRDHGKTTLTAAITKVLSETAELNSRAMLTLIRLLRNVLVYYNLHCSCRVSNRNSLCTCRLPSHADYVKNMIRGSSDGWWNLSRFSW
ncbi:hypothetical protein Plhal304r1_c080g0166361 [Plasmopara halstedii]